jgi:HSP20 family molecular chaperone IbpA
MRINFTDLIVADQSHSAQGRVHFINAVDIYETDDALVLTVDLPGVSKEAVSIEIHQNTLMLRGERTPEAGVNDERYHRTERAYGPFQRSCCQPWWIRSTCRRPTKTGS